MLDRRDLLASAAALLAFPATALGAGQSGDAALNTLFDQFMKENLDASPVTVTSLGLDTGARAYQKSQIDDASLAGIGKNKAITESQFARLKAFDRNSLTQKGKVSYDVIMYGLAAGADADKRFSYGPGGAGQPYILSQLTGSYSQGPSFLDTQHVIANKADAEAYLARLAAFAVTMDQEIEAARHDVALGVVPPDFALAKTVSQMKDLRAPAPEKSSLVDSLVRRAKEKNIAGDWGAQAVKILKDKYYPALDRQIALVAQMQKHAVHDAGVWRLPDGAAYYRASLKSWATTDKSPEEIHKLGLDVVADSTAKIDALMKAQGMTKGNVGDRLRAMFKDPKFLFPNTDPAKDKVIADLNAKVREVRARLPAWFGTLPKAEVTIKRVPKNIEAAQPMGYYNNPSLDGKRPGIYWINLRDPKEVPSWTLPSVTFHESIPGHHLQLSLQQEAGLPLIRKTAFFSAYIEGWALYAEQLAVEMGLYDNDPLGHIGQLHDAMWRGIRLVVDSGMHAMKWSREKAVDYFASNAGDPESAVATEVERYCVWPGQACSYMLGKLEFLEQRERAKKALGAKFDIRKFHDAMLLAGAVPLSLMPGLADSYISSLHG
ncbi:MAG TPA: DUF885 family protein, partial [Rhizomicrobium sp.]|nr:DUF885 family protein [Rhizomicrobium sp.]